MTFANLDWWLIQLLMKWDSYFIDIHNYYQHIINMASLICALHFLSVVNLFEL